MILNSSIHKITLILTGVFLLLISSNKGISQNDGKENNKSVIGGFGNYEYLYGGIKIDFRNDYYFETALGIKPWGFGHENYLMGYLALGSDLKDIIRKQNKLIPSLQLKILVWSLNNKFNYFLFCGITPEAGLRYKINDRISIKTNGGVAYNFQIIYKRKTYEEVGWPKDWQPTFSMQINYKLK